MLYILTVSSGTVSLTPTVEAMQALWCVRVPELLELNMPELFEARQSQSSYEIVIHRRQDVAVACLDLVQSRITRDLKKIFWPRPDAIRFATVKATPKFGLAR